MSESLKDILSHLHPGIDQETLLLYLQDKLSEEQRHEVEKGMLDSDFDADALEGLEQFTDKKDIGLLVDHLNRDLKKRTARKKRLREKLSLRLEPWLLAAIIIILLLAVIGFVVVRARQKAKGTNGSAWVRMGPEERAKTESGNTNSYWL